MKSSALYRSLARASVAVATIATIGAPAAFAAQKNQKLKVNASSATFVSSTTNSFAGNLSFTNQFGGGPLSNQKASTSNSALSVANSEINATSGNVIVVNQQQ